MSALFSMIVLFLQLTAAQLDAAKAAYRKLTPADLESHKAAAAAPKTAERVEVSERMRSASFGQRKFLLVAADGKQYWVEFFPSTNRPGALYGPFDVTAAKGATPSTPSNPTTPDAPKK
ncbi:MAG: hypothetical protein JWN44_6741 [Myxococcales bacterium]|nr:hypothetical protein [Myxococcales bacterium]